MEINPVLLGTYVTIARDLVVTVAAIITAGIAIYGLRFWKRDLVGKESYEAAKALVYQSHAVARASNIVRFPIRDYERLVFTKEQVENTTEGERWRISEAAAYRKRLEEYSEECVKFSEALLNFRVIAGSQVFFAFLPFQKSLEKPMDAIYAYIGLLEDHSMHVIANSDSAVALRDMIFSCDDHLGPNESEIADSREKGERFLLPYLHRKSISS